MVSVSAMWLYLFLDKTVPERTFVELTPDPQKLSDRPEWCFVHYNSTYHPSRSFEFEFQWVVTTAALLSQLVIVVIINLQLSMLTQNSGHYTAKKHLTLPMYTLMFYHNVF